MHSLALQLFGDVPAIASLQRSSKISWLQTASNIGCNSGTSSTTWVPTQRPDLKPPNFFAPAKVVSRYAMLCVDLQSNHHRLVERQTCSTGISSSGTLGPEPKSCQVSSTLPSTMAPSCVGTPVPYHVPSFKTIFIKHASVVDILCNHKSAVES